MADYLTPYEAEAIKKAVIAAALDPANGANFLDKTGRSFAEDIGNASLDGRTRSEALALVLSILHNYAGPAVKAAAVQAAQQAAPQAAQGAATAQAASLWSQYLKAMDDTNVDGLSSADAATKMSQASDNFLQGLNNNTQTLKQASESAQEDLSRTQAMLKSAEGAASAADKAVSSAQKAHTFTAELAAQQQSSQQALSNAQQAVQVASDQVVKTSADVQNQQSTTSRLAAASDQAKTAAQQASQNQGKTGQAIADTARTSIAALTRPPDVGCAMSILSWREVQVAFGRLLANEYIGVQVVVRNLNDSKQFLVHDAELAFNSDLNNRLGRFYSGRDQKIVRQLALAQEGYFYRNLVVNLFGAVGTLASAAMPFAGPSFKDATGVYNSGFLTALAKTFPDRSVDQLNMLNDVGFSASTESKAILVPKSGAVMFVMFVPSKPFEEGWWVQDCAHDLLTTLGSPTTNALGQETSPAGIDILAAQKACGGKESHSKVAYAHWSSTAYALFQELAFAVVAGTHIAEESTTASALAKIDCPVDQLGNVDFTKQVNGSITCNLTGTNLDKVAKLKLRDAADATDNTTADGSVTISGDTTTAKVDFALAQLGPLQKPDYRVYMVTKNDAETDAKQTLHFSLMPYFASGPTTTIALSAPKANATAQPTPVQLTGYHLDKIGKQDKIQLRPASGSQLELSFGTPTVPSTVSFDVVPGKEAATGDAKFELWYVPSGKDPQDLNLSVTFSGMLPVVPTTTPATPVAPQKQKRISSNAGGTKEPPTAGH